MFNFNYRFINFISASILILFLANVQAEENNLPVTTEENTITSDIVEDISSAEEEICDLEETSEGSEDKENEAYISILDAPHNYISLGIETMARGMDEYFSDDKATYELSGSYLLLRQNVVFTEGGNIGFTTDVYFKLRLPNTEKKLKLFFETTNEKQPYDIFNQSNAKKSDSEYITGLQGESGEKFGWKYKPTLGLRLNSTIEPFARFNFNTNYKFDKWSINWHETPYWARLRGWGFDSYFELNRKVGNNNLFRSSTFAGWREDVDYFELSQIISMFHNLGDKRTLSYFAGAYGRSKPTIYTSHFLIGMAYKQRIYKDYLFAEIAPQVLYQEINNFKPEHSLTFRFEFFFKK
ncbi:MAG TPA: hypothetical protein ENJ28_12105 [Gammaproteobacteria bacterium]|nr:hypothetical protein [Gammaproteobacteria bacterium]